jgi:ribosomal subunit interface protein
MWAYWEDKLPRLERLLKRFPDPLREMWLTVSTLSHPERFETKAVIRLPTGTLAAEEVSESWEESFDKVADELARQIKRHKEKLRGDWVYRRKRRRQEDFRLAGAQLESDRAASGRQEFFDLLGPLMQLIRDHAKDELRRLEKGGRIRRGEVSVSDLTDEVLVRAWERFDERPAHGRLDMWLLQLLDEVIEWFASQPAGVSIESTVVPLKEVEEEFDTDNEGDLYAAFFREHALATLADVLPDRHAPAWDALEASEQRSRIEDALWRMEPSRRLAFIYHALEGFHPAEIAMMLDRSEEDIIADIEAARDELRQMVTETQGTGQHDEVRAGTSRS